MNPVIKPVDQDPVVFIVDRYKDLARNANWMALGLQASCFSIVGYVSIEI
jgi:hypothetical protein